MTDLHYATIDQLGSAIRSGETSPVELAKTYMSRLDTVGRDLNAVVTITEERALREAELAERELRAGIDRGPLHGIPWGAKDLLAAKGYPTSWGAAPYRDQVFDYDAHVVEKLREAGAVLVAKLAMIELAGGGGYEQPNASFTGPCKVPWNTEAWSGGSSSGSGAAVAAGAVGFAIGSETRGSIHSPANNCGISGLRPTYGRVSRRGAMALSWTFDKLGPMARSAHDCGLILNAIAGRDPLDDSSLRRNYHYPTEAVKTGGFRFGVLERDASNSQPEVLANFNASLAVLAEIGTLEPVELPELPYDEVSTIIIWSEMAAAFEDLITSDRLGELTAPEDRVKPLATLTIPAHSYLRAMRIRKHIDRKLDEFFAQYDAILSPTMPKVAAPIDGRFSDYDPDRKGGDLGGAVNIGGQPGLAIPNGFGERGLPTSLCITTRVFEENTVLQIGNYFQSQTDWHTQTPAL